MAGFDVFGISWAFVRVAEVFVVDVAVAVAESSTTMKMRASRIVKRPGYCGMLLLLSKPADRTIDVTPNQKAMVPLRQLSSSARCEH